MQHSAITALGWCLVPHPANLPLMQAVI